MKQSSIDWLVDQLPIRMQNYLMEEIEKARQMHKEEISESFEVGYENGACVNEGECFYHGTNYYNKTYERKTT